MTEKYSLEIYASLVTRPRDGGGGGGGGGGGEIV